MAGKSFSVHVDIGGRLNASLGAAVRNADNQISKLGRSIGVINARTHQAIGALGTGLTNAGKKVQDVGRNVSTSLSAPVGLLAFAGGKMAYDYEKELNFLQALGDATDEQRAKFEGFANFLNKKYPQTLAEIARTGNEMLKGGFSFEQMLGGIDQTLATAVLGEMTPADVGNMMSRTINSFQMPMATYEQAMASSQQVSDRMTYAAVKTTASLHDMGEMFRYVGGAMSAGGQDIDKATAFAMAFAKNGTVASEAGVALRSAIVRLVKMPAKGLAALNRIGMDLSDYTRGNQPITADRVLSGLEAGGIDAKGAKNQIKKLLADRSIARDSAKLGMEITKAVQGALGSSSAIDASVIAENVNDSIIAAGTQIDVFQFFNDLQAKVESGQAGMGDVATILEGRHFARYQALFQNDLNAILNAIKVESGGYTMTRYGLVLKGIVGPTLALGAATEKLSVSFSKAVFPVLAVAFERIADGIQDLSESNPALIKFAAFTGLATIALGPFLVVAGATMRVLGPLSFALLSLGRIATVGLAARLATVAGGVQALAVAATVGAAARLRTMATALGLLLVPGGGRMVLAAMAGGLASFGKAVLTFPVVALRGIGSAAMLLVANPVGLTITAIVTALTALGVWVANNWEGLKSFFSGFAEGLGKGINPQFAGVVDKIANGFGSIYKWVSDLLGPIQATNAEWKSWGETVGGAVANAVNVVAATIERIIGLFSTAIEKAQNFASALNGIAGNGPLGATKVGNGHAGSDPTRAIKKGDPAAALLGTGVARIDGTRAKGGPVWGGGTFLVGENGPELFSPGRSGNITPNHDLQRLLGRAEGGASSRARSAAAAPAGPTSVKNEFHFNISGVQDPHQVARIAREEFVSELRRMEGRQRGRLSD